MPGSSPRQRNDDLDADLHEYRTSTPLARALPTNDGLFTFHDANIVLSRAFEQVAALRSGKSSTAAITPKRSRRWCPAFSEPAARSLQRPVAPLSPLGETKEALPLGLSGLVGPIRDEASRPQPTLVGQWFLYSVGPDRVDDKVLTDYETNAKRGDLYFPCLPNIGLRVVFR